MAVHALRRDQNEKNCFALNKRVFEYIKDNSISNVILVARWTYYTDGGYSGKSFSYLGVESGEKGSPISSRSAFLYGLSETIKAYADIGTQVHFITQIPQQKLEPKDIYNRAYQDPKNLRRIARKLSVKRKDHEGLQAAVNSAFTALKEKHPTNFNVLNLTNFFCDYRKCLVGTENKSFYFDDDHLSIVGSTLAAKKLINNLRL